jgi:ElaB/YqjD/DUF883 family membrane-anchored ribosome-binding protein
MATDSDTPKKPAVKRAPRAAKPAATPTTMPVGKVKAAAVKKPAASKILADAPATGLTKLKSTAQKAKSTVTNETSSIKDQAGDKLRSAATTTKTKAVEAAGTVSKIVDDAAGKIDENFGAQYGDYARTAAKSIDDFAAKMEAKDVDQIADDARDFVKKRPAIAIGAAAAIGFAIIRLFKSGGKDKA